MHAIYTALLKRCREPALLINSLFDKLHKNAEVFKI